MMSLGWSFGLPGELLGKTETVDFDRVGRCRLEKFDR